MNSTKKSTTNSLMVTLFFSLFLLTSCGLTEVKRMHSDSDSDSDSDAEDTKKTESINTNQVTNEQENAPNLFFELPIQESNLVSGSEDRIINLWERNPDFLNDRHA